MQVVTIKTLQWNPTISFPNYSKPRFNSSNPNSKTQLSVTKFLLTSVKSSQSSTIESPMTIDEPNYCSYRKRRSMNWKKSMGTTSISAKSIWSSNSKRKNSRVWMRWIEKRRWKKRWQRLGGINSIKDARLYILSQNDLLLIYSYELIDEECKKLNISQRKSYSIMESLDLIECIFICPWVRVEALVDADVFNILAKSSLSRTMLYL